MHTLAMQSGKLHSGVDAQKLVRAGLLLIVTGCLTAASWAAFAPLTGAIIVAGVVKVEANRKTVQHLEGGLVKEIFVREGESVELGQPLFRIADEQATAEVARLTAELDAKLARAARLTAERDGLPTIEFPTRLLQRAEQAEMDSLLRTERTLFDARRQALREQLALVDGQLGELQQEQIALQAQEEADRLAAGLLKEEYEANERLLSLNFISKVQLLKLQRALHEYKSKQSGSTAAIARVRQRMKELQVRAAAMRDQVRQAAAADYATVRTEIATIEERLKPARDMVGRQQVLAPIAGTVVDLRVSTVGGSIAPREPLLDIVPRDNPLIVEAHLSPDDIRHVHPNMHADVRFTTYDSRSVPMVSGVLSYVSADQLVNAKDSTAYFLAHIRIDAASLASIPAIHMQPGMRAEIFLRTAERTASDYFLDPLISSLRRTMREP